MQETSFKPKLSKPVQKLQIEFTGKLPFEYIHGEIQTLIAVDKFSQLPIVKICKTSEAKEVINFFSRNFNL